jgi:TetR/AcrR family transcriptional repressor of mexJK operon
MTAMNNEEETGPDMLKRPRMRLPDDRARMLIEAAVGEFLANGFRRGSVENIARVTGIGKATIYRHFTDKNGLFQASVLHLLDGLAQPSFDFASRTEPPEAVLMDFALQAIALFMRDKSLALHRMIIEAGHNFPELARTVHDRATEWSLDTLKPYLERLASDGVIAVDDLDWASHQFINLVTHGILYLMTPAPADLPGRRVLAAEAVALFLGGAASMRGRL